MTLTAESNGKEGSKRTQGKSGRLPRVERGENQQHRGKEKKMIRQEGTRATLETDNKRDKEVRRERVRKKEQNQEVGRRGRKKDHHPTREGRRLIMQLATQARQKYIMGELPHAHRTVGKAKRHRGGKTFIACTADQQLGGSRWRSQGGRQNARKGKCIYRPDSAGVSDGGHTLGEGGCMEVGG